MKQHIKLQDLDRLTTAGKRKLANWCAAHDYFNPGGTTVGIEMKVVFALGKDPLLSIGQMIEFLGENLTYFAIVRGEWVVEVGNLTSVDEELCDALWYAVAEKLNGV